MNRSYIYKKVITLFFISTFLVSLFSEDVISLGVGGIEAGIYENGRKFLQFVEVPKEIDEPDGLESIIYYDETDKLNPSIQEKLPETYNVGPEKSTLKLFYAFYYDGEYILEEDKEPYFIAQIENNLYLKFWTTNTKFPNFWIPGGNMTDISLYPARRLEKLTGYYINEVNGKSYIYAVNYWLANIEATDEVAWFNIHELDYKVEVPKHIQLGSMVYTCTNGRGKRVRNPISLEKTPYEIALNAEKNLMGMGEPFLVKSAINDMQTEITEHNSIYYPPRFSIAVIKEPQIYSLLEQQDLTTLSYPWRNEFLDNKKISE